MQFTLSNTSKTSIFGSTYRTFGMQLQNRHESVTDYRYGFNGKEKLDELHSNIGDSYDFGARMYDARIGKFLSIDPKIKGYPFMSPYSIAGNNPILYIDFYGEHPKVAIIMENAGKNEFTKKHKAALEAQGYKVIVVKTGAEALLQMGLNSTSESPIENLILISHGSPGGMSNGEYGGLYTQSEMEIMAKDDYEQNVRKAEALKLGILLDSENKNYDADKAFELVELVKKQVDDFWDNPQLKIAKKVIVDNFKAINGAQTVEDFARMTLTTIETKNLTIVVGGCNTSGKEAPSDKQMIFTTELAKQLKANVYGAVGTTGPINGTSKRKIDGDGVGTWIRTDSKGIRTSTGKKVIDMANPK